MRIGRQRVRLDRIDILILDAATDRAVFKTDLESLASVALVFNRKDLLEYNAPVKMKLVIR